MINLGPEIFEEFSRIGKHLELKASASRFVASVQFVASETNATTINGYVKEAKALGVNLWMCRSTFTSPKDPEALDRLAECYEAAAAAISTLLDAASATYKNNVSVIECLKTLSLASVYLRVAVSEVSASRDKDQIALSSQLRDIGREASLYLPLKTRDGVAPTIEQIALLNKGIGESQERLKLGNYFERELRELAKLVAAKPTELAQWQLISKHVSRLVSEGIPSSNIQIREILLPVFEFIPASDDYDSPYRAVIRSIDDYLASRADVDASLDETPPTEDVAVVRELLQGRRLVLIGGLCRHVMKCKLENAFALEEMIWVPTKPHEPIVNFKSSINRNGVAAVLLAIKLASHGFGGAKSFCDKVGVPLVRLPAGYGVNQVAHQLLQQCGKSLRSTCNIT